MKKIWENSVILFATMGFWGMIYPDLCFTEDVCVVAYAENAETDAETPQKANAVKNAKPEAGKNKGATADEVPQTDIFTLLCEADPEQIKIKSKWLDILSDSKGNHYVIREE